jgi:hypothetical protein
MKHDKTALPADVEPLLPSALHQPQPAGTLLPATFGSSAFY